MLRSMYAGISGMKGFQTKLDVVGNNIANVNTSGFKKGRITFQDMMSQTTRGAQAATANRGGINPMQVGLGSQVGSIDNIHTQGFRQSTGNPLDFAIEGNGMFVVQDGPTEYYTRAGNFYLDDNGFIVNPDGYYLKGFDVNQYNAIVHEDGDLVIQLDDENGDAIGATFQGMPITGANFSGNAGGPFTITYPGNTPIELTKGSVNDPAGNAPGDPDWVATYEYSIDTVGGTDPESKSPQWVIAETITTAVTNLQIPEDAQSFSVSTDGKVNYVDAAGMPRVAGQIALASFSNPAGLEKVGSNLFLNSANAGFSGINLPDLNGMGKVIASALEMSNVDLGEEFTEMIIAQRGFQANTRIITTSDEILQELVNLKR